MDELEAELVSTNEPALERFVTVTPARKGRGHTFTPLLHTYGAQAGKMSEREATFLSALLKTGSIALASQEIGISRISGYRYTKRPHIKKYLDRLRLRAAKAADLTADKIAAVIGDAVEGDPMITPLQLHAASIAAKMLAPARGPSVVINQQTNFNGTSPFADLGQTAMLDEIKRNLLEMGAGPDSK